jgi:anti-anti-sigma regulatory factor
MPKDDSNDGFLSKMVKFVRHPTTSWTELDARSSDRESEFSKAALKEMIERKKRNDFVRKREFEMLRKVRSQAASASSDPEGVRASIFPSSLASRPNDRSVTLRKIDEIEAQMSKQWWKTKCADSQLTVPGRAPGSQNSTAPMPLESKSEAAARKAPPEWQDKSSHHSFRATEPMPLMPMAARAPAPPASAAPTPKTAPSARPGLTPPAAPSNPKKANPVFSVSGLNELDMQEIEQDPEVEEAAIRFANGDDAGAEKALLEVLGPQGSRVDQQEDWLALFDLYRSTGQLAPFETRAVEFVNRFSRSAPQWVNIPMAVAESQGKGLKPVVSSNRPVWVCDPVIDAHAVGSLQNVLSRASQPWVLDWTPVQSIEAKAAQNLLLLFQQWADQDVALRFVGSGELRKCLKERTPSGQRDVDPLWWTLRLAVLRIMKRADEFELTALDFCVTYELSPPGWERPRCQFQSLSPEGVVEFAKSTHNEDDPEQGPSSYLSDFMTEAPSTSFNDVGMADLGGELLGDPQDLLNTLERRLKGADVWIISCRNLIRVDFSAAGTVLNWVSGHHAQGRTVQFVDVHRLVAAFFHVIGITEYAKLVLRND